MTDANRFDLETLRLQDSRLESKPEPKYVSKVYRRSGPHSPGVWLPNDIERALRRLRLKPVSRMSVLLEITFTWCRYGRKEAWLTTAKIADETGWSLRTVKEAVKELLGLGIIKRVGRGRLVLLPDVLIQKSQNSWAKERVSLQQRSGPEPPSRVPSSTLAPQSDVAKAQDSTKDRGHGRLDVAMAQHATAAEIPPCT